MHTRTDTAKRRRAHWRSWLLCPLVVIAMVGGAGNHAAAAASSAQARTSYSVIQLGPAGGEAQINDKGQVAFAVPRDGPTGNVTRFYDGTTVLDVGPAGSVVVNLAGLNEHEQIAGSFFLGETIHAFLWSAPTGTVDLGAFGPPPGWSLASGLNNKDQVVGNSQVNPTTAHAVLWSSKTGMLDLGTLGGPQSEAMAINDKGQVTGRADSANNVEAFIWTKAGGMRGIGTLAGGFSIGTHINAVGQIAGVSLNAAGESTPFFWSPETGMIGIGGGGLNSSPRDINDKGMVVGAETPTGQERAFVWTRETGILHPGAFAGFGSAANSVNNRGQVVGRADAADGSRAFIWTLADGLVDLNTRIVGAPTDMVLRSAGPISNNGSIVAVSNTGIVLLVPRHGGHAAPVIGPVTFTGTPRTNILLSFAANFTDADLRDTHTATWYWGDGTKGIAIVSERNGVGSVSGQHVYRAAGIYTARLTVEDNTGKRATVERRIVVCGCAGSYVAGEGAFQTGAGQSSIANFAFLSESGAHMHRARPSGTVVFNAPGLHFRGDRIDSMARHGGQAQLAGSGSVNGRDGYKFMLTAGAGAKAADGKSRLRIRVWHQDPHTKAEVVDFDNRSEAAAEGTITVDPT